MKIESKTLWVDYPFKPVHPWKPKVKILRCSEMEKGDIEAALQKAVGSLYPLEVGVWAKVQSQTAAIWIW